MRPSLWMLLHLLTSPYKGEETEGRSPYKGEGKCGSPDKGEESERGPHKSLKSQSLKVACARARMGLDGACVAGDPPTVDSLAHPVVEDPGDI